MPPCSQSPTRSWYKQHTAFPRDRVGCGAQHRRRRDVSASSEIRPWPDAREVKGALQNAGKAALAALAAAVLNISAVDAAAARTRPLDRQGEAVSVEEKYRKAIEKKQQNSLLPSSEEAEAMLDFDPDMFTPDAWLGMRRLATYSRYVESLEEKEDAPECSMCKGNRLILEKAWQVVASEFYDPHVAFSQAEWAGALQATLERHGGLLKTKGELYAAAREMVEGLKDPYSEFMEPPKFRAAIRRPSKLELDYLAAQAVGIGMRVGTVAEGTGRVVTAAMSGSSAEAAGVAPGDLLMSVEGIPAASLSTAELYSLFRGPVGSSLQVVVKHPWERGTPKGIEMLELERQTIPQPSAVTATLPFPNMPDRALQYIRINHFSSEASDLVLQAIIEGELMGADGFVIDLRNNPGGVFEEAVAIASFFLDGVDTPIVQTVRYTDETTHHDVVDNVFRTSALSLDPRFPRSAWGLTTRPVVVIVNSGSASASEVLAGALQDNQRAVVIGEQTFGKGVIQYFFRMDDGSGIKLTVAKYLTPGSHDISLEGGVQPDMVCHDHPRGILPAGRPDSCILQAMQFVSSHPLGTGYLQMEANGGIQTS